jgi:hypothetical protein
VGEVLQGWVVPWLVALLVGMDVCRGRSSHAGAILLLCDDLSGDVISEVAGRAEVVGDTGGGC